MDPFCQSYLLFIVLSEPMGNQVCCDDFRQENPLENIQEMNIKISEPKKEKIQMSQLPPQTQVIIPQLSPQVAKVLQQPNFSEFLAEKIENEAVSRKYGEDVYVGPVDEYTNYPQGFGRMYKSDGSLFVGTFRKGKANGLGAFIFPNGAYFMGKLDNNQASCQHGQYQAEGFKYSGGFKNNKFEGMGKEEGPRHTFEGEYNNGKRARGTLKWREDSDFLFFYTGSFNSNQQFHGYGTLAEMKGVYEGDFVNGLKEGKGYYRGVNGVKYKGDYKNGVKEGLGEIYNSDDTLSYKGEFKNGLPHGKGTAYNKDRAIQAEWVEGIDKGILDAKSIAS